MIRTRHGTPTPTVGILGPSVRVYVVEGSPMQCGTSYKPVKLQRKNADSGRSKRSNAYSRGARKGRSIKQRCLLVHLGNERRRGKASTRKRQGREVPLSGGRGNKRKQKVRYYQGFPSSHGPWGMPFGTLHVVLCV